MTTLLVVAFSAFAFAVVVVLFSVLFEASAALVFCFSSSAEPALALVLISFSALVWSRSSGFVFIAAAFPPLRRCWCF